MLSFFISSPFVFVSVFSGYIKEVDAKPTATNWGKKMSFGDLMAEFGTGIGGGKIRSSGEKKKEKEIMF